MRVSVLSTLAVMAFAGAIAFTQNGFVADRSNVAAEVAERKTSLDDEAFLKKLAQGGVAEVEAGKLAMKRANDPEVKAFARQMVDNHTRANEKLKSIANERQVPLPTVVDPDQSAAKSKLEMQNSLTFDAEYMGVQIKDHQQTVELLRDTIARGRDAGVKQFAKETLPMVSHHLEMAKQLHAKIAKGESGSE